MADYSDEIATAIEMIEEFGGTFDFAQFPQTTPDAAKPWRKTPGAPLTFEATAVMLQFKQSQQSQGFTAGSEDTKFILPGDMIVYLAAGNPDVTFKPMPRDLVTPPGLQTYNVVDNLDLAPNGTSILYKLWVRK